MKCGACGWDNRDIARYCRACGIDLIPAEELKPSQPTAEEIQAVPQAFSQPTGQSLAKAEAGNVIEQVGKPASQENPPLILDCGSREEKQDSVCTTTPDEVPEIRNDVCRTSSNLTEPNATVGSKNTVEKSRSPDTSSLEEPITTPQGPRHQYPLFTEAAKIHTALVASRRSNAVRYSVLSLTALTVASLGYLFLYQDHSAPLSSADANSPSPAPPQVQTNSVRTQPAQVETPTMVTTSDAAVQPITDATSHSPKETSTVFPEQQVAQRSAKKIYASYCMKCHANGVSGSPAIDNPEAWSGRLSRPRADLYALPLRRNMAPCSVPLEVTDVEVRSTVDLMIQRATAATAKATSAVSPPERIQEPKQPIADASDWVAALRSELDKCKKRGFFEQVLCTEKARWKFCDPNRWDTVKECEVSKSDKPN